MQQKEKLSTSNWNGPEPWLHLHECMFDEKAIVSLKNNQRVMKQDELDGRNNEEHPETHEEVVAKLCNDPELVHFTEVTPDLHFVFAEVMELDFKDMPGGEITSSDAAKRIAEA